MNWDGVLKFDWLSIMPDADEVWCLSNDFTESDKDPCDNDC